MKLVQRVILLLGLAVAATAVAQDLRDQVTLVTLDNGMRVIFVEDDAAPVITFNLMFDVGGVDEPAGLGGIAHMVEHMAFKGTPSVGSLDPEGEAAVLAEVEVLALNLEHLRKTGTSEEVEAAQAAFDEARTRAQRLALTSPLDDLFSTNGGVGLNASTSYDRTSYTLALPSNRLELYARVYADVLFGTTFRLFYEERDVVRQERRQRNDDDPQGFLLEAFTQEAFGIHPYGRSLIGPPEEIETYTASEAQAFFEAFYHPNRAVLALVGDIDVDRDLPIIERFFGVLEPGPDLRPRAAEEPPQLAERRVAVEYDAEPQIVIGYHKPTYPHRDAFILDLVDAVLSTGRTSRLFRRMVLQDQSALDITTISAYPGTRFDNLFVFYGLPRAPFGTDDLETAFLEEIERLKTNLVSEEELQKVKNQVRAASVLGLASASGLASSLAFNELFAGGWETFIDDVEVYQTITAEEIRDAARRYFTEENRTVAVLVTEEAE